MHPAAPPDPNDLSAGALLNAVIGVLRAHPVPILAPFVLLGLLGAGGDAGASARFDADFDFRDVGGGRPPVELLPFFVTLGLLGLAILVLLFFLQALAWLVTTRAAFTVVRGEGTPDLGRAFEAVRPIYLGGVWTYFLVVVAVLIGFVLLVVPGFVALAALVPWAAIVVAEARTGPDALGRAWELTKGHKVDLFLLVLLAFAIQIAAAAAFGWLPLVGGAITGVVDGVVNGAAAVLAATFYHRKLGVEPLPSAGTTPPPDTPTGSPP